MKRTEAIAWLEIMKEDAIFEQYDALKMAIEALQIAEINCVHCPRYYETEDDIGVHSHCGSHGRLIDADALMEYCSNQKTKTIDNNDIARFPIVPYVADLVRCKDCKHQEHCHETVAHTKEHDGFREHWAESIEWCSRGERKGGEDE